MLKIVIILYELLLGGYKLQKCSVFNISKYINCVNRNFTFNFELRYEQTDEP